MHQLRVISIGFVLCGLLAGVARADTFQLNDGSTLTGDIVSGNEAGLVLRLPDDTYSKPVAWTNFSQADIKKFATDPAMAKFKLESVVSQYIEVSEEEKRQKTDIGPLKDVPRLKRPAAGSFFGAMTSSSVGLFIIVLVYAAGIYAAYEIAIFRRRPVGLVCGLAAIPLLGFLSPIIFLSMPTRELQTEESYEVEGAAPAEAPTFQVPGMAPPEPEPAVDTGGLKLSHSPDAPGSGAALPQPQIFQRGAFMFNRRFFETKFPNFFGMVRREAEKDMILQIKAARGVYIVDRISRISANDLHVQVHKGHATEEVMIPFTEVQEIQLKHKDSP